MKGSDCSGKPESAEFLHFYRYKRKINVFRCRVVAGVSSRAVVGYWDFFFYVPFLYFDYFGFLITTLFC